MRAAALVLVLFAFWLVLSGIYTPFLVLSGLAVSIAVALFAKRMGTADPEGCPVRFTGATVTYWPWLLKEIVVCGLQVAWIVVHPRMPISPALVRFKPSQKSTVGLVTHANSITLTPGTITVTADHESFLVHALTRAGGAGLEGSEMDRRVERLEGTS